MDIIYIKFELNRVNAVLGTYENNEPTDKPAANGLAFGSDFKA